MIKIHNVYICFKDQKGQIQVTILGHHWLATSNPLPAKGYRHMMSSKFRTKKNIDKNGDIFFHFTQIGL